MRLRHLKLGAAAEYREEERMARQERGDGGKSAPGEGGGDAGRPGAAMAHGWSGLGMRSRRR